jgi:glycosyltransferase involved in cell wall biosynthesis
VTDPLTVIQVLPALDTGGVERGTLEIAAALVEQGHRSIVISAGGRLLDELVRSGSEHILMPVGKKSPLTLRYIPRLRKILLNNGASILHARSRLPAWISYLAWKGLKPGSRPRFVTSVHGPYSVNRYSGIMMSGEKIIAVSNFIASYIYKNYPEAGRDRVFVIPRGINPAGYPYGFRPEASWLEQWFRRFPETREKFLITLPARLTRWKGHEEFLRVVNRLEGREDVHGIIAGGAHPGKGSYLDELVKMARRLGIQDKVSFTGHRDDLREIMGISNAVLSLSREPEAFGRTTLEALALGVPVIGYAHGGVAEVLQTIFPQGLVPPGDLDAVSKRINQFRDTPPTVPDNNPYTLERMQNTTIALYQSLVNPGNIIGQASDRNP